MNKQTVEKLTLILEEALQKLREAHHVALLESDQSNLGSFHELCARIANEIDQGLIAPFYVQYPGLRTNALEGGAVCLAPKTHC